MVSLDSVMFVQAKNILMTFEDIVHVLQTSLTGTVLGADNEETLRIAATRLLGYMGRNVKRSIIRAMDKQARNAMLVLAMAAATQRPELLGKHMSLQGCMRDVSDEAVHVCIILDRTLHMRIACGATLEEPFVSDCSTHLQSVSLVTWPSVSPSCTCALLS